jgi:membrane protein involved in D-alanine export
LIAAMPAYGDFTYFGLLLYIVVPTVVLGLFGWIGKRWILFTTALVLTVQLSGKLRIPTPAFELREIWFFAAFGVWQTVLAFAFLKLRKPRFLVWPAVALSIAPLVLAKAFPLQTPAGTATHLGLSYITFRVLDVILSIHDGVIRKLSLRTLLAFVFFFPVISSGPIDRYRRFEKDFDKRRTRAEFLDDLDVAIARVFRGFLYKFVLAMLIHVKWIEPLSKMSGPLALCGYMYAYTFYLFFDFAGYSAFAIGFSRLFGIRTPENFDLPFLSRNIRDFWNRWHISLSFWFRDHIYMRFLIAATKAKWFKGRHTANYVGLFITFGLMGLWHGTAKHYILYGLYHATLLCGFDWFARWNKERKIWPDTRVGRIGSIFVTFHVIAFGLLLFAGKLTH